jgi:hypothetical protein
LRRRVAGGIAFHCRTKLRAHPSALSTKASNKNATPWFLARMAAESLTRLLVHLAALLDVVEGKESTEEGDCEEEGGAAGRGAAAGAGWGEGLLREVMMGGPGLGGSAMEGSAAAKVRREESGGLAGSWDDSRSHTTTSGDAESMASLSVGVVRVLGDVLAFGGARGHRGPRRRRRTSDGAEEDDCEGDSVVGEEAGGQGGAEEALGEVGGRRAELTTPRSIPTSPGDRQRVLDATARDARDRVHATRELLAAKAGAGKEGSVGLPRVRASDTAPIPLLPHAGSSGGADGPHDHDLPAEFLPVKDSMQVPGLVWPQ